MITSIDDLPTGNACIYICKFIVAHRPPYSIVVHLQPPPRVATNNS